VIPSGSTVGIACSGAGTVTPVQRASLQGGATADVQISNAIAALSGGNGIVWADYSTNQTWAACPTFGSGSVHLALYPVTFSVSVNCTIPSNVTLQFLQGSKLSPATGTITTINGPVQAPLQQIFTNANPAQGAIDFTGDFSIEKYYPEWWGCSYNAGTAGCNGGLQAAIYAAYGCNPNPVTACRTNATSGPKYNRILWFSNLYAINVEMKVYHMIGFRWEGEGNCSLCSGIQTTNASNLRILDMQSVAYGTFSHLTFANTSGSVNTNALIDDNYDASQGVDLAPQNTTFDHCFLYGNGLTDVGVLMSRSGTAQGDNIRVLYSYFSGFTGAGYQIGGNNTGRNVGRMYAQNAIKEQIIGGDFQGNPLYGIASYGGSYEVYGTTMENNIGGGILGQGNSQNVLGGGADMYCEAPQGAPCRAINVRSESLALVKGGPWTVEDSGLNANWAATFDTVAGNSEPLNQLITGTWVGGDGKYYKVTVAGTFGGLSLTTPTSASATTLVNSGSSYTTNAFVGNKASIMQGTDAGCYGIVTSNSGTTITFSAGLVTDYDTTSGITCTTTPDATSKFVIEPNWGTQTTSGGATFALFDFNAIDGPFNNGSIGGGFYLRNVQVGGGKINATGHFEDIQETRADWYPSGFWLENTAVLYVFENVLVSRTGRSSPTYNVPWNLPRNGITGLKNYSALQIGTLPICWAQGQVGGGISTVDICAKVDPNTGIKNGRFQIVNNSSGSPLTTNFNADGSTQFPAVAFASLPSSPNGSVIYCSDCNSTCTAGSSTGRTCFRENNTWTH
jgi:hypothetical protein